MSYEDVFKCGICFLDFNKEQLRPMMICNNHHTICSKCLEGICREENKEHICPFCRVQIVRQKVVYIGCFFQYRDSAQQLLLKIQLQQSQYSELDRRSQNYLNQISRLNYEVKQQSQKNDANENKIFLLLQKIRKIEGQQLILSQTITKIRSDNEKVNSQNERLNSKNNKLNEKCLSTQKSLNQMTKQNKKLSNQSVKLKKNIACQQISDRSNIQQIINLKMRLAKCLQVQKKQKREMAELKIRNAQITIDRQRLRESSQNIARQLERYQQDKNEFARLSIQKSAEMKRRLQQSRNRFKRQQQQSQARRNQINVAYVRRISVPFVLDQQLVNQVQIPRYTRSIPQANS